MSETIINTEGTILRVERIINATKDKIWDAWTKKELFEKWWGPRGWNTTVKHMNFTEGGYLHYGMHCEDPSQGEWYGQWSWGKSVYKTIDPKNSFIYTDYFADENCVVNEEMPSFDIEMKFEEVDGGTKITSTSDVGSEESLKQLLKMGMIEGLKQTWDRLEELVENKE